jgi:hypothetical protein
MKRSGTISLGVATTAMAAVLSLGLASAQQSASGEQKPQKPAESKPAQTPDQQRTKSEGDKSAAMTVKAGDIAGDPAKYYGKKVKVRAEVEDVLGRQMFLLDEDKLFAWPDVLVVAPPLTAWAPEDEIVTVVGTVRAFVDVDLRRDYDWDWWGDLDTDVVATFNNRPVIMADSIMTANGAELVKPGAKPGRTSSPNE